MCNISGIPVWEQGAPHALGVLCPVGAGYPPALHQKCQSWVLAGTLWCSKWHWTLGYRQANPPLGLHRLQWELSYSSDMTCELNPTLRNRGRAQADT